MTAMPTLLKSPRLIIRHAQSQDIPAILHYYTENKRYLAPVEPLKPVRFYTRSYWENELSQRLTETEGDRSLKLFIFLKQNATQSDSELIGTLNFSNFIRGVFQSCTVGYSLAQAYQGQGYMSEALQSGIQHMFTVLQFHRVSANYLPTNQRSGELLKRLGFQVEGYARDYLFINGQWKDHILTSLINPNPCR